MIIVSVADHGGLSIEAACAEQMRLAHVGAVRPTFAAPTLPAEGSVEQPSGTVAPLAVPDMIEGSGLAVSPIAGRSLDPSPARWLSFARLAHAWRVVGL